MQGAPGWTSRRLQARLCPRICEWSIFVQGTCPWDLNSGSADRGGSDKEGVCEVQTSDICARESRLSGPIRASDTSTTDWQAVVGGAIARRQDRSKRFGNKIEGVHVHPICTIVSCFAIRSVFWLHDLVARCCSDSAMHGGQDGRISTRDQRGSVSIGKRRLI